MLYYINKSTLHSVSLAASLNDLQRHIFTKHKMYLVGLQKVILDENDIWLAITYVFMERGRRQFHGYMLKDVK